MNTPDASALHAAGTGAETPSDQVSLVPSDELPMETADEARTPELADPAAADDATAWLARLGALRSRIDPIEFAYAHTMVVRALREDDAIAQSILRKVEARLLAAAEREVAPYAGAGEEALASFERARQMYEDALTSLKNAQVVADAMGQLEVDAGPYNAAHLVTQSLARMSRLSVGYLDAFLERMQLYALLMGEDENAPAKPKAKKGFEETGTAAPPKRGAASPKRKTTKLIKR